MPFLVCCFCYLFHPVKAEDKGSIRAAFFKHGAPFRVQVNLHRKTGPFLSSHYSNDTGQVVINGLPFGEYFLITHPVKEMPVQWRTSSFRLATNNRIRSLPALECFGGVPHRPPHEHGFQRKTVSRNRPIRFEWSEYPNAEFTLRLDTLDGRQKWESASMISTRWSFFGTRLKESRLASGYRWWVQILTPDGIWRGRSRDQLFYQGSNGKLVMLQGLHTYLKLPRKYRTAKNRQLMLEVLDRVYEHLQSLTGNTPFNGKRMGVLYDPNIRFTHSGNPIHIGSNFWQPDRQPWLSICSEMSNNFQTGSSEALACAILKPKNRIRIYRNFTEGLAAMVTFLLVKRLSENTPGVNGYELFTQEITKTEQQCREAGKRHLFQKRKFAEMTPDIMSAFLLSVADDHGAEWLKDFFQLFQKEGAQEICNSAESHMGHLHLVIAALETATPQSIMPQLNAYGFPVIDALFKKYLSAWVALGSDAIKK
jgi:hypothetical protein